MFKKRIFNLKSFIKAVVQVFSGLPKSIDARRLKRIDRLFVEKIRLAATAVNNCEYCSYAHSKIAIRAGMAQSEIERLLRGEIDKDVNEFEITGLLFAQHFAETQGNPESEMIEQLKDFYEEDAAADIIVYLREIQFGNLCGNTFEAFISRIKGEPAQESNVFFEAVFFILTFPVLGILHVLMRRENKQL